MFIYTKTDEILYLKVNEVHYLNLKFTPIYIYINCIFSCKFEHSLVTIKCDQYVVNKVMNNFD